MRVWNMIMRNNYYKLKPEIRDFIIKESKERPRLGCRKLVNLIQERFGLEVSKSSVNAILKEEGLSQAVGRPAAGGAIAKPASGLPLKKSSPYQGEAAAAGGAGASGRGLTVEEKPLLAKIEREISLTPRIIKNDKFPPALQQACRQIQVILAEEKSPRESVPGLGCWFLKASELCLGGLQAFSARLSLHLKEDVVELLAKNEALFYLSVLGLEEITDTHGFWEKTLIAITGRKYSHTDIQAYLESLKQSGPLNLRLFAQESLEPKEVRWLKFVLEDGRSFFLDGSTRSIWSRSHIPLEFSQGLSKTRDYLRSAIIQDDSPLIGQALPGFKAPPPAFLNFISAFCGQNPAQAIKKIEFYDNEDKLIETLEPIPLKRHYFILAVWPWQYPNRSILEKEGLRLIGYKPEGNGGQPNSQSRQKGDREILTILTNLPEEQGNNQRVMSLYLERWPNLEAGYHDFLDKIGHYFELKKMNSLSEKSQIEMSKSEHISLNQILDFWRMKLNNFCRRHFLPLKYADADFSLLKERFYSLPGVVQTEEKTREIIFCRPQEASHYKDLIYACQRVNEADLRLGDGRRLKFEILT